MTHSKFSVAALLFALTLASAPHAGAEGFPVPNEANQYMFDQINQFRAENGLPRLRPRFGPGKIADDYSLWLAQNNKSGHFDDGLGPEGRMKRERDRVTGSLKDTYEYCGIWENIHESWSTPSAQTWKEAVDSAMTFWKTSPGHRANMLRSEAQIIGLGIHGWRDGDRWTFKEVTVFVDRSCLPRRP